MIRSNEVREMKTAKTALALALGCALIGVIAIANVFAYYLHVPIGANRFADFLGSTAFLCAIGFAVGVGIFIAEIIIKGLGLKHSELRSPRRLVKELTTAQLADAMGLYAVEEALHQKRRVFNEAEAQAWRESVGAFDDEYAQRDWL